MKKVYLLILLIPIPLLSAQNSATLAPNAENQLITLLNNPEMIFPAIVTPLGKNWFRVETDIHVFTDQANFQQVSDVLLDLENQDKIYNGKRSSLTASIISMSTDEIIVDFISIDIGPFGIKLRTPYRASVKTIINTDIKIGIEFMQLASDSSSNRNMKNFYSTQFAEEIIIDNRKYIYIRIYTISDVNASILPRARGILEREAASVNIEGMHMIINAARDGY